MKILIIVLIILGWIIMSVITSFVWITFFKIQTYGIGGIEEIVGASFFIWPLMLISCLICIFLSTLVALVKKLYDLYWDKK